MQLPDLKLRPLIWVGTFFLRCLVCETINRCRDASDVSSDNKHKTSEGIFNHPVKLRLCIVIFNKDVFLQNFLNPNIKFIAQRVTSHWIGNRRFVEKTPHWTVKNMNVWMLIPIWMNEHLQVTITHDRFNIISCSFSEIRGTLIIKFTIYSASMWTVLGAFTIVFFTLYSPRKSRTSLPLFKSLWSDGGRKIMYRFSHIGVFLTETFEDPRPKFSCDILICWSSKKAVKERFESCSQI